MSGNSLNAAPLALPHFTQLRTLNLARNPITSLAFTPGLRLRELDIRHLPLESFEVSPVTGAYLTKVCADITAVFLVLYDSSRIFVITPER